MFGTINHDRAGSISKHAISCRCNICRSAMLAKAKGAPNDEQMHLATAHSMHHREMADKHSSKAYGYYREGTQPATLTVDQKAQHLQAQSMHRDAAEHFADAARAYRDGLPMGASEHMKIAQKKAASANTMSQELGVA
jgi:hypothetical protein